MGSDRLAFYLIPETPDEPRILQTGEVLQFFQLLIRIYYHGPD